MNLVLYLLLLDKGSAICLVIASSPVRSVFILFVTLWTIITGPELLGLDNNHMYFHIAILRDQKSQDMLL